MRLRWSSAPRGLFAPVTAIFNFGLRMRHQRVEFAIRILGGLPAPLARSIPRGRALHRLRRHHLGPRDNRVEAWSARSLPRSTTTTRSPASRSRRPQAASAQKPMTITWLARLSGLCSILVLPKCHYGIAGKDAGQTGHGIAAEHEEATIVPIMKTFALVRPVKSPSVVTGLRGRSRQPGTTLQSTAERRSPAR
jgi:hypothetical protein